MNVHAQLQLGTYINRHLYMYMYTYTYSYSYMCTHMYMYLYMYVSMYTHIFVHYVHIYRDIASCIYILVDSFLIPFAVT